MCRRRQRSTVSPRKREKQRDISTGMVCGGVCNSHKSWAINRVLESCKRFCLFPVLLIGEGRRVRVIVGSQREKKMLQPHDRFLHVVLDVVGERSWTCAPCGFKKLASTYALATSTHFAILTSDKSHRILPVQRKRRRKQNANNRNAEKVLLLFWWWIGRALCATPLHWLTCCRSIHIKMEFLKEALLLLSANSAWVGCVRAHAACDTRLSGTRARAHTLRISLGMRCRGQRYCGAITSQISLCWTNHVNGTTRELRRKVHTHFSLTHISITDIRHFRFLLA